jgi:phenylalanine-4-hydroxylase
MSFERGIQVEGIVREVVRGRTGKNLVFELDNVTVRHSGKILVYAPSYTMAIGEKIISAFAGPADVEAFQPTAMVPHEKMHKITYDADDLKLHELYRIVRQARSNQHLVAQLPPVWKKVITDFPDDWLLSLEILEVLLSHPEYQHHCKDIQTYLEIKRENQPQLEKLITNGLRLLNNDKERLTIQSTS